MFSLLPTEDPMLHTVAKHCPADKAKRVIADLQAIYKHPPYGSCAGMAAPQIGYPYNAFVALGKPFVNVKNVKGVGQPVSKTEGCFSIPGKWYTVKRYGEIIVTIGDSKIPYAGYIAQVIQHEYDHVRGILICDHSTR